MSCDKRVTETASDSSYIYQIFSCVIENTRYINRLRFFKQVKDELDRISSKKQSPEIVALIGDWGQGKTAFLDILEEYSKNNNIKIFKIPFTKLLNEPKTILTFKNNVYLIDEVESSVDYFEEHKQEIRDFWNEIKELANSEGNSVIYLSITSTAYSKIFEIGGHLYQLFPETYQAFLERIRKVNLGNPSKLEFLLMMNCMLKLSNIQDSELLKYMDLAYWVIDQERRKYVRYFNDIICTNYPNLDKIFNDLARSEKGMQLNAEGETVKLDVLTKLENSLDQKEIEKLYRILMSRIFIDRNLIIKELESDIVKGFLVPYSKWVEEFPKFYQDRLEDFLLTYNDNKFFIFLSDNLERVVDEEINIGKINEILIEKLRQFAVSEAYALSWSFFENIANTNISDSVVEFRSREIRDKALKFVNTTLNERERELDAIENFIEIQGIKILNKNRLNDYTRFLRLNKEGNSFNIIITKPVDNKEMENLINEIKKSKEIINGVIIIDSKITMEKLIKLLELNAIAYTKLQISTPKKRQLLYLLFSKIYNQGKVRSDVLALKLGDIKNPIFNLLSEIINNINLKPLPETKKELIPSFNWLIFYPDSKIVSANEIFDKVNEVINERFRIYGAKQFHLEDIETANTFVEDVLLYFFDNKIVKINDNYIDFSDFVGETLANFSRLFAGFIKQKYKQEAEEVTSNYILYLSEIIDIKRKDKDDKYNPYSLAYQLFSPDKKIRPTLDFLVYASITTGQLAKNLNYQSIYEKIVEYCKKRKQEIESKSSYLRYGYFITAKKRGAAIRSLSEMKEVIEKYLENCIEKKDIRLCYDYLYTSKLYLELLNETENSVNEVEEIRKDISSRLQIIESAKKYLNINEEIEEVKKIRDIEYGLEENFEHIIEELAKKIQQINEEGKTNDFKKFLDSLLEKINKDKYNRNPKYNLNLYFILFKLLEEMLNGEKFIMTEKQLLKGTIIENILSLSVIGNQISSLTSTLEKLNKISPQSPKISDSIEKKKQKVDDLIREIKEMIENYNIE
ncbi:MAG: hypothetical protein QW213_06815 [Thermoproteota archaeon]|nr:hypothetical protein [Candidatus Rehaiarchaeum fermentans]